MDRFHGVRQNRPVVGSPVSIPDITGGDVVAVGRCGAHVTLATEAHIAMERSAEVVANVEGRQTYQLAASPQAREFQKLLV